MDALRAVAVVSVVLYHANVDFISGGYVGVDIFFVISGFLITKIIVAELSTDSFSVAAFYERRIRRLFPALFAVLLASTVAACGLLLPVELEDFGETLATTAVFASNFMFANEAGYFEAAAEQMPLLHTWSLAIEEQFYLLFPWVLVVAAHRRALVVAALLGVSLVISSATLSNYPDAAFYLLPSRAWELMLGAALVFIPKLTGHSRLKELGGWVGLLGIGVAVTQYDIRTEFPGINALLPCLSTALIIYCAEDRPDSYLVRALSVRPLVLVGLISYSLYLWHWPIFVFFRHFTLDLSSSLPSYWLVPISLLVAWISWRFIERPFRNRHFLSRGKLFTVALISIGCFVSVGLIFDQSKGLPLRLPQAVLNIAAYSEDKPPARRYCEGIAPAEISYESVCRITEQDVEPSFVVWGDSHAMVAMPAVGAAASQLELNGLYLASNGCVPLIDVTASSDIEQECVDFNAAVVDIIAQRSNLKTIFVVARWGGYAEGRAYNQAGLARQYLIGKGRRAVNVAENHRIFEQGLNQTVDKLQALERRVVILASVPEIGVDLPTLMAKSAWHRRAYQHTVSTHEHESFQQFADEVFSSMDGSRIEYVEIQARFCSQDSCETVDSLGRPLYIDNNHLSRHGVARLQPLFLDKLKP
ncbi:MAG: acyltransferase family protein [Pseudomonadales bacterium]